MKRSLKIIAIGSIFLLCGASVFGIFSLKEGGISSGFWNVHQLVAVTAHAEDDEENESQESNDDNRNGRNISSSSNLSSQTQTQATTIISPSSNATSPQSVISPSSSNTSAISAPTCTTVYDTVTSPSGTASQVPRQVCTIVPNSPSISAPIPAISAPTPIKAVANQTVATSAPVTTSQSTVPVMVASSGSLAEYIAPNEKKYIIHSLSTGAYIFERPDGSVSSQKFTSYQNVVDFIDRYNHQIEEVSIYTAPNGNAYTILNDLTAETYLFRRANGSVSNGYFATKDTIMAYIDKNNPLTPVKPIIVKKAAPAVKKAVTIIPKTVPVTIVKAPSASTSAVSAQTSSVAALARQKAQAAATQQAAIQKQAQAAAQAAAQKVNTTTRAS